MKSGDPIPSLEPISQEIKKEEVGAFRVRVQVLMDLCGKELSKEIADVVIQLNENDLEDVLAVLEEHAKDIDLGNFQDEPAVQRKKEEDFRAFLYAVFVRNHNLG